MLAVQSTAYSSNNNSISVAVRRQATSRARGANKANRKKQEDSVHSSGRRSNNDGTTTDITVEERAAAFRQWLPAVYGH